MPFSHGRKTKVEIQSAAQIGSGNYTDISAYLTDQTLPFTADSAETSTFGVTDKTYVVGLKDKTVALTGLFDPTIDALLYALVAIDPPGNIRIGPAGGATGAVRYTFLVLVTNYQVHGAVGGVVDATLSGQGSGAATRDTYP